jgi:hypothetical protein
MAEIDHQQIPLNICCQHLDSDVSMLYNALSYNSAGVD